DCSQRLLVGQIRLATQIVRKAILELWQFQSKSRRLACFQHHATASAFRRAACDRQPETQSLMATHRALLRLDERLKNVCSRLFWDRIALVGHTHDQPSRVVRQSAVDLHWTALRTKTVGVVE